MDATYRWDLRELNELHFARFDAKLEQRVAYLDAKMMRRFAEFEALFERRLGQTRWSIIAVLVPMAAGIVGLYFAR